MKYIFVLLLVMSSQAFSGDLVCDTGDQIFSPSTSDTVIATNQCSNVTVNCTSTGQCDGITIFAAASNAVTLNCLARNSCRNTVVYIGLGSSTAEEDGVYPTGYSAADFTGTVNDFSLNCGDGSPSVWGDRRACQNMELNVFEDVVNQNVDCSSSYYGCVEVTANLYNSSVGGDFNWACGGTDYYQCDASTFAIETAGADFDCSGVTCVYVGCTEVGCTTQSSEPDIIDPDNDGQSAYFDADDDGDGIDDVIEEQLGLDPNDNSDANGDIDNDGLSNVEEIQNGTDPTMTESSVLDADLSILPKFHRFGVETLNDGNCQQNSTPVVYTVSNKSDAVVNVASIAINASDSSFNSEYQLVSASDNCSGQSIAASGSCQFEVVYCPQGTVGELGSSSSAILEVSSDSESTPIIEAALSSFEGAREEAQRRLPPIASSLSILDSGNQPVSASDLNENETYTVNYTVSGYHASYDVVGVLFDCSSVSESQCGLNFGHMYDNSGFLSPASQSTGDWSYNGISITNFTYSFTFTTPSVTADQRMVLRLYQKSLYDIVGGKFSLSLILPGNLPLDYIDASGRRVAFTVKNTE